MDLEVAKLKLCNHCLGRLFGMKGHGLSNEERGRAIRVLYAMEHNINYQELIPERCELCGDVFKKIDSYAEYAISLLSEYDFDTFLVGSVFPPTIIERERELQERYSYVNDEFVGESIGREFNRELGKRIMELTHKDVDLRDPDIKVIVDIDFDDIRLEIKPLFIYGRYRKLIRGIPQTKWPSGKYNESVEELIAKPIMEMTGGIDHALHGLGREDIDARMLGNGRPFILEIKKPKRRKIDLNEVMKRVNAFANGKVEVMNLRFSNRDEVRRIKSMEVEKRYHVGIVVNAGEEEIKKALQSLIGKIRQRTPTRVSHRRADKIRVREIYDAKLIGKEEGVWMVEILAQSGTYIKELMHGDGGRTKPSLAERLGKDVKVEFLDVVEILDNLK